MISALLKFFRVGRQEVRTMEDYKILGNKVTAITSEQLNQEVKSIILQNRKELILNTNVHGINLAQKHPWLKQFRNLAAIVHCDGAGVMLGLRILGLSVPCRITIHGWMASLAELCVKNDFSMFFLGARPGIAELAAGNIRDRYPGLRIIGTHHGYFEKTGKESDLVVSAINKLRPDIVIVGFGMPIQEKWIKENWEKIDAHIFVPGGGCFNFLSGAMPTCPKWLANMGFEWLFRLASEPRRLFVRYVWGNSRFLLDVFKEKIAG